MLKKRLVPKAHASSKRLEQALNELFHATDGMLTRECREQHHAFFLRSPLYQEVKNFLKGCRKIVSDAFRHLCMLICPTQTD